jgi:crotonobetainyl-CoA:carnitine CoA-transferase CaiB-like acyl-CoA transferase
MDQFAFVPEYQTSLGRLQAIEIIEPAIQESLLTFSSNDLFYKAQEQKIPLARVPTMEELLNLDQFLEREAFTSAILPDESKLTVPGIPFRLMDTPPSLGGNVAELGEHTENFTYDK